MSSPHPAAVRAAPLRLWAWLENPVMDRELRGRMRGARSYWITGVYTLVVAGCVLLTYWRLVSESGVQANLQAAEIGRAIWTWGCLAQAALLPLIVPAFTCGAITLERERDLLELLLLTHQSPVRICLGKLTAGAGLGMVLVVASVPLLALSLFLGGVSPVEMGATLAVLLTSILAAGALGLVASSVSLKTVTASVAAYMIVGFGLVGLPLLVQVGQQHIQSSLAGAEASILIVLGACLVVSFAPALGLAALIARFRSHRKPQSPDRAWWILTTGLCMAALLLLVILPGAGGLLLQGQALLVLHPVIAIQQLMDPGAAAFASPRMTRVVALGSGMVTYSMMPMPPSGPFYLGVAPPVWRGLGTAPPLWSVCSGAYLAATAWFFLIAVIRVRRMRSG